MSDRHKNDRDCWCNPTEQADGLFIHFHRSGEAIVNPLDDRELANRVIDVGVGSTTDTAFYRDPRDWDVLEAHEFVRDPRVAIALMERCRGVVITLDLENAYEYITMEFPDRDHFVIQIGDSLPRAIIEACVTALEGRQ